MGRIPRPLVLVEAILGSDGCEGRMSLLIWNTGPRTWGTESLLVLIKTPIKKSRHGRRRVNAWLMGLYHLSSPPRSAPQAKPGQNFCSHGQSGTPPAEGMVGMGHFGQGRYRHAKQGAGGRTPLHPPQSTALWQVPCYA